MPRSAANRRPKHVTLRVTPTEHRELKLLARAKGVSTSEAIRSAIRESAERVAASDS